MANQGPQTLEQQLNALKQELHHLKMRQRTGPGRDLFLNALEGQISELLVSGADVGLTMSKASEEILTMMYVAKQFQVNVNDEVARPDGYFNHYGTQPIEVNLGLHQATWIGELLLRSQFNIEMEEGRDALIIPDDPVSVARMEEFKKYLRISSFLEKNAYAGWIEKAYNDFSGKPADKKSKFHKKEITEIAEVIVGLLQDNNLTLKEKAELAQQQFANVSQNPKSLSKFHQFCAHQAETVQDMINQLQPAEPPRSRPGR
ncbi:MAG: hypothetical protein AB7I18_04470 [Candidatus Berkiella sp.]